MSLCTIQEISLGYGARSIFRDLSFLIGYTDRVGLVGANGAGKSSLMKMLAGVLPPDGGTISFAKEVRAGYLPQELVGFGDGTLLDAVLAGVDERVATLARFQKAEEAMNLAADEDAMMACAEELAEASSALGDVDQLYGPHRAAQILCGLGFKETDFAKPANTFSGGWRMRGALASLLLRDPDLLLLDEPTNHLDLPTLAWLDDFLSRSGKALVLISHDREFLNRHTNRILWINQGNVTGYTGNYDDYEMQKALEQAQREAKSVKVEAKRAQLQRFIDRFGAKNTKATQAKSKQKMIDRLEVVEFLKEGKKLGFRFPEVAPSGKDVLLITGLQKRFGEKKIYEDASAHIARGDRIAIVGVNGAGKTTLLKLVADELPVDSGTIKMGHQVSMAYYAQHHGDKLDATKTIFAELDALVPDQPPSFVRKTAGAFLFSGDDIEKSISVLSGGERARVALAKLLLLPSNFMLLDEPTNHLDIDSAGALLEALQGYQGTLLFVSHNEDFVRRLATKIWEVEDGVIRVFSGSFDEYLESVRERRLRESQLTRPEAAPAKKEAPKEQRKKEDEPKKAKQEKDKGSSQKRAAIEKEIETLEESQKKIEAQMSASNFYTKPDAATITKTYEKQKKQLEQAYHSWETL
jgi:ATP-binding cassette subfamily F protein 3